MDFITALQAAKHKNKNIVIPDIKCRSPKEGDLLNGRTPVSIAGELVAAGAPVLSVVTNENHFGGSKSLLLQISSLGVPVLRKDFMQTRDDIRETKALGASAVLLMYSCLDDHTLLELYNEAKSIGLDVLLETHTREELRKAALLGAELVGINNRNIGILEKDDGTVALTEQLAPDKPKGCILVSESGLQSPADVRKTVKSGADAALVGTALLKANDIGAFYKKLCRPVCVKLCGMMSDSDIQCCSQADILGFVVEYPKDVPWNIQSATAKKLISNVPPSCESCVVTGGSPEKVIALANELKPDYVQLHYNESMDETARIVSELTKMGIRVIRSISCSGTKRKEQFGSESLSEISDAFAKMGVSELLVDSRNAENAANAKENTPIFVYREMKSRSPIPVILAGGITSGNVLSVLEESGADRIDIMTGIELSPGIKSRGEINKLFNQIGG